MFMLFDGCAPANKITYTWTNPSFKTSKPYKKIFLAALVNNPHVRTHLEEELKDVETQLVESGKMLIFDVKDVSEAVVEGYMSDYYSKIAEAHPLQIVS